MNSTTLPPLKPRANKLYASTGGINANTSSTNLNATIATSGVRNRRNSSASNGIQVQQLYDSSTLHRSYLNHSHHLNHQSHHNHSLNTTNIKETQEKIGQQSPSVESLNSNKSLMNKANLNNNNVGQLNANSSLLLQQHLNSTNMKRTVQPMSPETAMKNYMQKLTPFEHHEIFNYQEIFFLGQNAKKIHGVIGGANNNGYDDENGSYKPIQHDHILYRFEILKILGIHFFKQQFKFKKLRLT